MSNRVLYCLRFAIGIVNPRWMQQAPSGETAHETVTLAFEVGKWHPRVCMVAQGVTCLLAIYGLYSFFV